MTLLVIAAIIPIVALCFFVYYKDTNKEPMGLLVGLFFLGFFSVFPVLVCELIFGAIFPMNTNAGFIPIFINVMFGVAMYEESFKWLITKFLGYNNKEFDEVYDVIIYSVFASLGFACFENILYVLQNGFANAIMRALLAIPGHTCFAISMGYFFSKAKVNQINGNQSLHNRNMVFSIIVPILLHTMYDALLFNVGEVYNLGEFAVKMLPFIIFYAGMVIVCFLTVDKTAKVQNNLSLNISNGMIGRDEQGILYYNYENQLTPTMDVSNTNAVVDVGSTNTSVVNQTISNEGTAVLVDTPQIVSSTPVETVAPTMVATQPVQTPVLSVCPICGKHSNGRNFCSQCGFRLK